MERTALDGLPRGLAMAMLECNSLGELRSLSPMPDEAQRLIDAAVVEVGLDRLVIAADVMAEGLITIVTDPLSVMEIYWEKQARRGTPQRTMIPGARGQNAGPGDRTGVRLPIYATTDEFELNIRLLRASQRSGAPLDVSGAASATRNVNEAIEDAFINGAGLVVDGHSTPGLLNAPNASSYAYVDGEAWTAAGHSGEDIVNDVLGMIDLAQENRRFGPYNLYIPTAYGNRINADFKANGSLTIRQRLEELEAGGRKLRIRVADQLPANRVSLVQMTKDVVDMVSGMEPTTFSWADGPGWELHTIVMAFMIPRVRDDFEGNSGIVNGYLTL